MKDGELRQNLGKKLLKILYGLLFTYLMDILYCLYSICIPFFWVGLVYLFFGWIVELSSNLKTKYNFVLSYI